MLSEAVFVVFLSGAVNGALCFALYKQLKREFRQLKREILSPAPATPVSSPPGISSIAGIPPIAPAPGLAPPHVPSDHPKPAIDFRVLDRSQPFYFGAGQVSLPVVSPLTRDIAQRPLLAVDNEAADSVLDAVEKELGCTFERRDTAGDLSDKALQADDRHRDAEASSSHEDSPVDCAPCLDNEAPDEQSGEMSSNGQTSAFANVGSWLWKRDRNASLGEKEFTDKNP